MKNKLYVIVVLFILLGAYGCEKLYDINQPKEPKTEYSSTYPISGEWWITYSVNNSPASNYVLIYTSNTAADDGKEIWIIDGSFWPYTVKAPCQMKNLTFFSADTLNTTNYTNRMLVMNGKVIKNGGHSPSGVVVDSIYFEVKFEDDGYFDTNGDYVLTPWENLYVGAGVRKTGFLEDEH